MAWDANKCKLRSLIVLSDDGFPITFFLNSDCELTRNNSKERYGKSFIVEKWKVIGDWTNILYT